MWLKLIQASSVLACLSIGCLCSCGKQNGAVHDAVGAGVDFAPVWVASMPPVREYNLSDGKLDAISDGRINVLYLMLENGEMFLKSGSMKNGDRIKIGKGEAGLFRTIVYVSGYYPQSIRTMFRLEQVVNGVVSTVVPLLPCEDKSHADALDRAFSVLLEQSQFEIGPEVVLRPISQGWSLDADALWRSGSHCSWRRPLPGQPDVPEELYSLWGTRVGSIVRVSGHDK